MSSRNTRAAAPAPVAPPADAPRPITATEHAQRAADAIVDNLAGFSALNTLRVALAVDTLRECLDGEAVPGGVARELFAIIKRSAEHSAVDDLAAAELWALLETRPTYAADLAYEGCGLVDDALENFKEGVRELFRDELADAKEKAQAPLAEALGHLLAGNVDDARRMLEQHADPLQARTARDVSRLTVQAPDFF